MQTTEPMTAARTSPDWSARTALFSELQDLKRVAPAGVRYSLADELYVWAWTCVLAGDDWSLIADRTACRAALYVLFPGVDATFFAAAALDAGAVGEMCEQALGRTLRGRVDGETYGRLMGHLEYWVGEWSEEPQRSETSEELAALDASEVPNEAKSESPTAIAPQRYPRRRRGSSEVSIAGATWTELPTCLHRLRTQPRAGATHPEHPRLVLLPPESHADHTLMTAVYAALTASEYRADPGEAFVCGLAHHLHNAFLPDCGWAGELALEPHLTAVIDNCRAAALQEFPPHLRTRLKEVLRHHESIATPEGEAISTGDVLDRVLDVKWRTRAAAVTDRDVLGDLDLVHPGPLKDFQTDLLNATGLWTTP